jgi:hypothetical protein
MAGSAPPELQDDYSLLRVPRTASDKEIRAGLSPAGAPVRPVRSPGSKRPDIACVRFPSFVTKTRRYTMPNLTRGHVVVQRCQALWLAF